MKSPAPSLTIIDVGYRSTHYWVISAGTSRLRGRSRGIATLEITAAGNVVISFAESRPLLAGIGIPGEILPTPGHTDHCVSLLLDDGSVFTGDLPAEDYAFDNPVVLATWEMLRSRGAARVYPTHGPMWAIDKRLRDQSV